jgi:hypothetical protein
MAGRTAHRVPIALLCRVGISVMAPGHFPPNALGAFQGNKQQHPILWLGGIPFEKPVLRR